MTFSLASDRGSSAEEPGTPGSYVLGPFRFDSELPLVELRLAEGEELHPVSVTLAPVPTELPGLARLDEYCAVSPVQYLLDIPAVARYLVEDGCRVQVEVADGAAAADVRGYLLGSVFGALCHQNGLLPLHASAVLGAGGVTAFLGDSGAGKSTTAAFLERRGYTVVSDDICLLERRAEGLRVIPVAGWLKLWRESYDHLGEQPEEASRVFSSTEKYRRYLPPAGGDDLKLSNLVFLERADVDEEPSLTPMPAGTAVAGLMRLTYLAYIPELTGAREEAFRGAAEALAGARAWRLRVPRGWGVLGSVLDLVESGILRG